jgi:N-acetylmuramoyl-L-alanine amidase
MVAYTRSDTVRLRYPTRTRAAVGNPPSTGPRVTRFRNPVAAILDDPSLDRAVSDTDNFIIGRPTPAGDYNWFLLPGTTVRVLEYRGSMARIELDAGRRIWVNRRDVKVRRGRSTKRLTVSRATVSSHRATVDLELRISSPPAYKVVEDTDGMTLVLYNARSSAKLASPHDSLIDVITQSVTTHRATYHIELTRPLYGYQVLYHKGVFRLEIRRPPVVNRSEPLRGMTIVVDPGHPPIGATGPTGLWEPVPTLAVGLRVQRLLEARGAHVVMTRTNADPVALELRPIMARRANANAFVSIHLNAVGDGQNPFRANGTGTYYFHPQSKAYARLVQDALVPELGLRDRGVFYQNLAVCRPTWFPAVLAEGLFIIMPDQEAAIKTPEYQEAYARGIVDGLERYFATFAR